MSLKNDYLTGPSGLEQNIALAFADGISFVGSGAADVESLSLGDRTGANLGAGGTYTFTVISANATAGAVYSNNGQSFTVSGTISAGTTLICQGKNAPLSAGTLTLVSGTGDPTITFTGFSVVGNTGTYFQIYGPYGGYTFWMSVGPETAPAGLGLTLVPVVLLQTDTATQVATKIAAALTALPNQDFAVLQVGSSIETTSNQAKAVTPLTLGGSGWGTAVASVVTAGANPVGNYLAISNALKSYAQSGRTQFKINMPLYGASINSTTLRANHGNNLILKAYFAGIVNGFANEAIYSYEVKPILNYH